jgi:hypothetical protein
VRQASETFGKQHTFDDVMWADAALARALVAQGRVRKPRKKSMPREGWHVSGSLLLETRANIALAGALATSIPSQQLD